MCVYLVGLSVGFSVFMLGHAQFHGCPSPALSTLQQKNRDVAAKMSGAKLVVAVWL